MFGRGTAPEPVDLAPLHAKIGQLALENDFLESRANQVWVLDTTYIRMARGVRLFEEGHPLMVCSNS